ncbi:TPA: Sec-independent protein translocase subunit TatB [Campylobacter coli]|uniref:Sec-independent protein translocase protein TatB n=1 Tax=Campylobacter coli TaxID=195 RepID=UPI0005765EB1|nr:Sec-independent protein translocase protein TatB [Campylobacter coli]MCW1352891.1 Sec-independent protein translocase protein TatB [Campylobacter jejuni]EAI6361157.1 Sec-independent protein translocase subunit TatB [Campylobacter coli]EAL1123179.1 Sec-independent protein translocase subunit TatB [Campylobacter coli]EDO9515345.1 Sec-independent protein translocase subunit TatB [Campylobacter coli]EFQ7842372.1 Sec-independent protein translocase subunit TatB [Campylobacter coli]
MSFGEIIVILIVAILVLGPDKLPEAIVQIAKILKALKRNIDDAKSSIEKEIRINDLKEEAKKYKDEFSSANENIRKKLSFEEFDDLKRDILDKTKVDLTFDSRENSTPNPNEQNPNENQKPKLNPFENQEKVEK